MDVLAFKCPIYLQAFNPPVFKCKFGHLGCGRCVAEHPGNRCKQCDKSVIDAVVSAPLIEDHMIECPNVSHGRLVASNEAHSHYIACPQGPCACTEPGCDFTGRPQDLLSHLGVSHSMPELIFRDGKPSWCSMEAPVQPQGCTFIFGFEDGGVFVMVAGSLGPVTVVSFLCVRSAACLWLRYTVEVLAIGPSSPAGTTDLSTDKDTLKAVMEPPSTTTPGAFTFNQLTSFLAVPPPYVAEAGPYKSLEKMDVTALQCPLCLLHFKLPPFKCKGGHVGCGLCVGEFSGNRCKQCEHPVKYAVVLATMVQCPHEGCRSLVASNEAYDHYMACPHGPCRCTELRRTGCDFTGPPLELLVHLAVSHSKPLFRFQYGMPSWCTVRAPVPPQGHMFICYEGEDGSVFAITIGMLSSAIAVSCVCIRSAACSSPLYTAQLLAIGPAPAGTTDSSTDTLMAVIEPMSTPTPSDIACHQLTSFLAMPSRYLRDAGLYRQLNVSVCINKKIIS